MPGRDARRRRTLGQKSCLACVHFPRLCCLRLWCQTDNTVKEIRNQYGHRTIAHCVQAGVWKVGGAHSLRVGHTHEDIDSLFSLCSTALRTSPKPLESPECIQTRLQARLADLWLSKGLAFRIEIVDRAS